MSYSRKTPQISNFSELRLATALTVDATSIQLADVSGLPDLVSGLDYIPMVIRGATSYREIVHITAINRETKTVTALRGQEGTTASSWNTTAYAYVSLSAQAAEDLLVNTWRRPLDVSGIPVAAAYVSATSFTVSGDHTGLYVPRAAIRVVQSGAIIQPATGAYVVSSSFSGGLTTVVVEGVALAAGLQFVEASISPYEAPKHPDATAVHEDRLATETAKTQAQAAQAASETAKTQAQAAQVASETAKTQAQAAQAAAASARDVTLAVKPALESNISALETGLMSLAMKQAVQAGDTDRSILMNGWLDPLTDAGQVALTGMEFQSGDTGYIQPTPAGSGVGVQRLAYPGSGRGVNLKGAITTFTVDTANTSGHFDATAHAGVRAGTYLFLVKDGANYFPAVSSVTGDGTAANSVAVAGTLQAGVYSVTGIYALATTEAAGTYMWQLNGTIGRAVNYAYAFDLPPFDTTYWTAITGATADAWTSRNPGGQVFGAVSFDGGVNYVIWNGTGWRGIVQNNAGTWRYYNPDTAQWVNATINDKLVAFSEALALTGNWWSLTPFYGLGTTDILTGGTVTASCEYGGQHVIANLVDNDLTTSWASTDVGYCLPAWVKYQLPSAKRAWKYRLYMDATVPAYSPHDWQFQGSNDNTNWTTLDTRSGQTWAAAGWKEYTIPEANRGSYLYYRLYITGGGQEAGNYMWINEWEVYEEVAVTTSLPNITQAQWAQNYGFQAGTTTDVRFMAALRTTDKTLAPYVKSLTMNVNRTTANGVAEFNAFTAVDPDIGRAVFVMQAVDTITLDTDLKAWMKRGTGAYAQVPLVQDSAYDATRVLVRGELDMSATPGTGTMFKLTTHNNKAVKVFQAANYFKSK